MVKPAKTKRGGVKKYGTPFQKDFTKMHKKRGWFGSNPKLLRPVQGQTENDLRNSAGMAGAIARIQGQIVAQQMANASLQHDRLMESMGSGFRNAAGVTHHPGGTGIGMHQLIRLIQAANDGT